jgi:hypothetical protein
MHRTEGSISKKRSWLAAYNSALSRYPLAVNGFQGALIAGLGVITAQMISSGVLINWREVGVMMTINFFYHTPLLFWFQNTLTKYNFPFLVKLAIDQFLFSPLFTCGIVAFRLVLLGNPVYTIPQTVLQTVPSAMAYSWMFWIPVRSFILLFIPSMYQLLTASGFNFIWNILLAFVLK